VQLPTLPLELCLKKYFPNFLDICYIDYSKYEWTNGSDGWKRSSIRLIDSIEYSGIYPTECVSTNPITSTNNKEDSLIGSPEYIE